MQKLEWGHMASTVLSQQKRWLKYMSRGLKMAYEYKWDRRWWKGAWCGPKVWSIGQISRSRGHQTKGFIALIHSGMTAFMGGNYCIPWLHPPLITCKDGFAVEKCHAIVVRYMAYKVLRDIKVGKHPSNGIIFIIIIGMAIPCLPFFPIVLRM